MTRTEKGGLWVAYKMTIQGKHSGMNAVCEQKEWDAMEIARPGYHTLIKAGLTSEGEAEKVARQTPVLPKNVAPNANLSTVPNPLH